jgi:dTMP kinase
MGALEDYRRQGRVFLEGKHHSRPPGDDPKRVCTTVVLSDRDDEIQVLVVRRRYDPHKGEWALPGGHAEKWETLEEGARRELKEETGITAKKMSPVEVRRKTDGRGARVEAVFYTVVSASIKARAGDDAAAAKWIPVARLPKLAFEDGKIILKAARMAFGASRVVREALYEAEREFGQKLVLGPAFDVLAEAKERTRGGLIITFEGVDGAGKSTQIEKVIDWLKKRDYEVADTKWNSSDLLTDVLFQAKKDKELSPLLFSLLHAADFIWRYENVIAPALEKGKIVVCDRYFYTSYARDEQRGVDPKILDLLYKDFRRPDVIFHCVAPVRLAVERVLREKGEFNYYSAGMDLKYSPSKEESALNYETEMDRIYKRILPGEKGYVKLDTEKPIKAIFARVKEVLTTKFKL